MFSLIISIISIALVAALAAATVYFGGAAFNKGSAGADASTFINAGQQIAGAFTLASADGHSPLTVDDLNNGSAVTKTEVYLAQIPSYKGTTLALDTTDKNYVVVAGVSGQICDEVNKRALGTGYDILKANKVEGLYGCVAGATVDVAGKVFYKVK